MMATYTFYPNQSVSHQEENALAGISPRVVDPELTWIVTHYRRLARAWHYARKRSSNATAITPVAGTWAEYLVTIADLRAASFAGSVDEAYAVSVGQATAAAHDAMRSLYLINVSTSETALAEVTALEAWIASRGY